MSWVSPVSRAVLLARRGPAESMRVPLCLAVHGHIADSARDHEPGSGGRIALDEEAEEAVHRAACSWISMVRRPRQARGKITGGRTVWPTHGPQDPWAVARTLLVCRVSPWTGRNCAAWRRGASFALPYQDSRPRQPWPAWPAQCGGCPRVSRRRCGRAGRAFERLSPARGSAGRGAAQRFRLDSKMTQFGNKHGPQVVVIVTAERLIDA